VVTFTTVTTDTTDVRVATGRGDGLLDAFNGVNA